MTRERFTTDPGHGRRIPRGVMLGQAVRAFLRRLRATVMPALANGQRSSLSQWLPVFIEATTPAYAGLIDLGMKQTAAEISAAVRARKSYRGMVRKDLAAGGFPFLQGAFDVFNPAVLQHLRSEVFNFCQSTLATIQGDIDRGLENLRLELSEGLSQGEALITMNRRAMEIFDDPERAARVVHSEASRAMNAGYVLAGKQSGVVSGKQWLASSDACPLCLKLNGRIVGLDEPFYVHPKQGPYAVVMQPPAHPWCVTGETPVGGASIVAGTRTQYQGPIVRVEFSNGSRVSVTPNHMLLGRDGFIRAADLVNGDDIISAGLAESQGLPTFDNPNNNRKPALAHEVFDALAVSGGVLSSCVPSSPEYLHGDAAFGNGNIDVVRADCFLGNCGNSRFGEPFDHLSFVLGADLAFRFHGGRCLASVFKSLLAATNGRMGRSRELAALRRGISGVANELRFRPAANRETKFLESSDYNRSADAKSLGHAQDAFPGLITTVKVCKVNIDFASHGIPVYDFETSDTMYTIGNGIVSSNCMCTVQMSFDEQAIDTLSMNRPNRFRQWARRPVDYAEVFGNVPLAASYRGVVTK